MDKKRGLMYQESLIETLMPSSLLSQKYLFISISRNIHILWEKQV